MGRVTRSLVLHQTVALKVGMSCQGCAGAVRRVLGKMEGLFLLVNVSLHVTALVIVFSVSELSKGGLIRRGLLL